MKRIVFVSFIIIFVTSCSIRQKKKLMPYKIIETDSVFFKNEKKKIYLIIFDEPDSNFTDYMKADETVIELVKKNRIMYCEIYQFFKSIEVDVDTITPLGKKFGLQNAFYIGKVDLINNYKEFDKLTVKDIIYSSKLKFITIKN